MTTKKFGTKYLEKIRGPVTFAKLVSSYRLSQELCQEELGDIVGGITCGTNLRR